MPPSEPHSEQVDSQDYAGENCDQYDVLRNTSFRPANALVQLQAHLTMRAQRAIEKCLSAATFVRQPGHGALSRLRYPGVETSGRTHISNKQSIWAFDLPNQGQGTMPLLCLAVLIAGRTCRDRKTDIAEPVHRFHIPADLYQP
jgi:hypothetical protein